MGQRPVEAALVAVGHRQRHLVDRTGGAVADAGHRIGQLERRRARPGEEHELVELGAGQRAVLAEMDGEIVDRLAGRGEAVALQRLGDELLQRLAFVGVAAQAGGMGYGLEQPAQRRFRRQIAGLDDDQRRRRSRLEEGRQAGSQRVAGVAQPHHAAPAGERQGIGLIQQAARLLAQRSRGQLADPEGIGGIAGDRPGQAIGALADQAGIGAKE